MTNEQNTISVNLSTLTQFLKKAKLETFVSGKKPLKQDFIRIFTYQEGVWLYEDRYTGSIVDVGLEIVKCENIPIWGMSYRGGMLTNFNSTLLSTETFMFLKQALKNMPAEMPVRGGSSFNSGDWLYKNEIEGDVQNFFGKETIWLKKTPIYSRSYQGGIVREKIFNILINGQ